MTPTHRVKLARFARSGPLEDSLNSLASLARNPDNTPALVGFSVQEFYKGLGRPAPNRAFLGRCGLLPRSVGAEIPLRIYRFSSRNPAENNNRPKQNRAISFSFHFDITFQAKF